MVRNGTAGGKTTRIPLSHALRTIKETAFERSRYCPHIYSYPHRYPLILSISVHCAPDWQKVAATLLASHLGNKLYVPAKDPTDWNVETPSPAAFIQKILIMVGLVENNVLIIFQGRKIAPNNESGEVTEDEEINVVGITPRKKGRTLVLSIPAVRTLLGCKAQCDAARTR